MTQETDNVMAFLARIQQDAQLREALNLVETAEQVVEVAKAYGHAFSAASLLELFERCNEAPRARLGLMDEKLIRVYLQRDHLS